VSRRQQLARQLAKASTKERVIWLVSPSWMKCPDDLKDRLPVGVSWLPDSAGKPHCYAKHLTGLVIEVIASPTAPRAEYEIAAKRLLDERVAEYQQQLHRDVIRLRAIKAARDQHSHPSSPIEGDDTKEQ